MIPARARSMAACLFVLAGPAWASPADDVTPETPITLDVALEVAGQNAVDAESARLQVEAARAALHGSRQAFLPDLGLSLSTSATVGRTFSEGLGQSVTTPGASSKARVTSTVPLFGGGERHADVKSAEASLRSASATLDRTREDLRYTLAGALLDLAEARGGIVLAEASLSAEMAIRDRVQAYVDVGSRTRADLLQEDAAIAAAQQALGIARADVARAELTLVQVLRLDPAVAWSFAPPVAEGTSETTGPPTSSDPRPPRLDVQAAASDAEAAEADVRAARARVWPSADLSFGASTSWYSTTDAPLPSQLGDQAQAWATVDIAVPIFDRAVHHDAITNARITQRSAELDLAALQLSAATDIARARIDQEAADAALLAATQHRDASRAAAAVIQDRYDAGAATLSEVLTARADLTKAEREVLSATIAVQRAGFELEWALGG